MRVLVDDSTFHLIGFALAAFALLAVLKDWGRQSERERTFRREMEREYGLKSVPSPGRLRRGMRGLAAYWKHERKWRP